MKKTIFLFLSTLIFLSCTDNGPSGPDVDDFDREAILVNWADNIIIPSFQNFAAETEALKLASEIFSADPTLQNLTDLRSQWLDSYKAWQHVSMFEMGTVMNFRDYLNTYPTNANESSFNSDESKTIQNNIETGDYNLILPSSRNTQGFPALDYLLYGLADNDAELLSFYTTNDHADAYRAYVTDLTTRIDTLTDTVLDNWINGYRDEFVSNTGSGANSSFNMMVNDFIFYYEKHLRAGKIGIPAGATNISSGNPSPIHVEAYYSRNFSKILFMESLDSVQNFFNGSNFKSQQSGESLDDYLDYLKTMKEGTDLSTVINNQFEISREKAAVLNDNFVAQVDNDPFLMLATYDELQRNVVYLKVDMLQALNITPDYFDSDGD
tara:strand:- start:85836 stop:86978 length:1143 start_codon:yes stop_codon:yes gene_type:complete